MALTPTVLIDAYILVNAVVISDHGNKVEIPFSLEALEDTTFGQQWKSRVGGLKDAALGMTLFNDYTAANLDSQIFALFGTVVPFEIRPTSAARSATNPGYTGSVLVDSWKPVSGDVGKLVTVDVSWPTSGQVLRQVV